ncbi:choice-of-anchor I family protein [Microbacterium sp. 1P10UB]|uniref:choice-of-anchor I family protein n=1 Tax=unclassified Microbacterium TaxID=2609290 RepID=UPI0039A2C145
MPSHPLRRAVAFTAVTAAVCTLTLTAVGTASAAVVDDPVGLSADDARIALSPIGSFDTGVFNESAAEIVTAHGDRLFVVDAQAGAVMVLDYSNPAAIAELFEISAPGVANSVAVRADGLGVIAFEAAAKTEPGSLVFFDADAADAEEAFLGSVKVGALPDMVTFSDDGAYVVSANEGEPADDFSVDPEGSVSVVTAPIGRAAPTQADVRTAGFGGFEGDALPAGVRVFGPDVAAPDQGDTPLSANRVSRNLEPEYVAIDGGTAYVTLQEANAVATVDLASAAVSGILPLGYKDWGADGNALDASDRDDAISIRSYEDLFGVYMPDGIQSYAAGGQTYLVTANEGDAREWGDFIDESRVKNLADDGQGPVCADSPLATQTGDADLGRLKVAADLGFDAEKGCYDALYAYGARSFSIWTTDGMQVYDSGSEFERTVAAAVPGGFNSNHEETDVDGRSDDKGPEPENVAIGEVGGRTYAFVGLERVGGVMVYDISVPSAASFVTYVNNRDFAVQGEDDLAAAGDLGPEGLHFIPAADSSTGAPMLAVGNEVSGTTTLFAIDERGTVDLTLLGINDFHGRIDGNTVKFAGTIEEQRAAAPGAALFLSSGDNIGASLFASSYQKDQPTIDVLNALGLDASAVGNHEFDQGFADLTDRVQPAADFPYLGANVYRKGTTTPALPAFETFDVEGLRVAVVGVVTRETASLVSPSGITGLDFGDPVAAVNRVAGELTDGSDANGEADVIVALYHEGASAGEAEEASLEAELAKGGDFARIVQETSPAVDAIFTGHTHKKYAWAAPVPGEAAKTRPILQTGSYGENIGRITLSLDAETGEVLSHTERNIARTTIDDAVLADRYPRVAEVKTIADAALGVATEIGNRKVAEMSSDITTAFSGGSFVDGIWTGGKRDDRSAESTLGNLVADALLSSTASLPEGIADIGVTNPGGLRSELYDTQAEFGASAAPGLADGDISFAQALAVLPFANTTTLVTMTGATFTQLLEEQWQLDANGNVPTRPYLQLGLSENVTYTYDAGRAQGDRITSVTVNGQPLDETAEYRVGTLSFLADGGDNFRAFTAATDRLDTGNVDYQAWIDFLAADSPVAPSYAKHGVQVTGLAPTAAGGTATFTAAGLNLTSLGTPETTELSVSIDGTDAGTAPVTAGAAEVRVTVPADAPAGSVLQVTLTAETGTVVTVAVPVTESAPTPTPGPSTPGTSTPGTPGTPGAGSAGSGSAGSGAGGTGLALTGADVPWGLALGGAFLVIAGGAAFVLRRRRGVTTD